MRNFRGDFLGFTFNGEHSSKYNVVRVINGDRHESHAFSTFSDITETVPGRDGAYYFGTDIDTKQITIMFAFDDMTDKQFWQLSKWLDVRKSADLILDETPYKKYRAKVVDKPVISFVPFDGKTTYETIYRGEGTITFEVHFPFGYSVTKRMDDYTDEYDKKWSLDHLPSWFWSAELLPTSVYNTEGWETPKREKEIYLAGTYETEFDMFFKFFGTSELVKASEQTVINAQTEQSKNNTLISQTQTKIRNLEQSIKKLEQKRQRYLDRLDEYIVTQSENGNLLIQTQQEILALRGIVNNLGNEIDQLTQRISTIKLDEEAKAERILFLQKNIREIDLVENPTEHLKADRDTMQKELINLLESAEINYETIQKIEGEKSNSIIELDKTRENIAQKTLLLEKITGEQETIGNNMILLQKEISAINAELSSPEMSIDALNRELVLLEGRREELTETILSFSKTGSDLNGKTLTITKPAQEDSKTKVCSIKLSNDLKGKTLRVNTLTRDVCYYDGNNNRFDYYDKFEGDFISAEPTGVKDSFTGVFDAGATSSYTVGLKFSPTAEERNDLIGKKVVFELGYKTEHLTTEIMDIRFNSQKRQYELLLRDGYTLTKGEKEFLVLNDLLTLNINDIRYIDKMNIVCPYKYD